MKVIIGSGKTNFDGWVQTQEDDLNLLEPESFQRLFPDKNVDCFLAEHVWEHLTFDEGVLAARNCLDYLKPGGYLRIAVPDGYFRNQWYQNMVQIGGPGPKDHPAASHKIVYNFHTFSKMLKEAGFIVNLLEYCDENGEFHYKHWNAVDGHIGRSYRFDTRNQKNKLGMVSLIADAYKEMRIDSVSRY